MNNTSTEVDLLSAYIDGELTPDVMREVEYRLKTDSDFYALLQKLHKSDEQLSAAFHCIDEIPMSPSLQKLLSSSTAKQKNQSVADTLRETIIVAWQKLIGEPVILVFALALPLVAFLFLTRIENSLEPGSDFALNEINSPEISNLLNQIIAGESARLESGEVTETLAFTRNDGVICKNFQLRGRQIVNAVSCFENGRWNNVEYEISTLSLGLEADYYELADGGTSSKVDIYIQSNIKGAPLGVHEERSVIRALKE